MISPIQIFGLTADDVEINKREAFRYMGCTGKAVNEDMEELYSVCLEDFQTAVKYKACYRKTDVFLKGDGVIDLGFGEFKSYHLEKNLEGCNKAYVFAATTGVDVDRLILRLSRISPSKAVITDATGSAAIEDFCDILNGRLKEEADCKPRFSCGYGDFSIENQKNILEFLNAYKLLGISLSESFLMTPKKSVTAIVGIKG